MTVDARVIADSISPSGIRVSTIQVSFWRPMLAEFNTHRQLSRNSASSRARPASVTMKELKENPAGPVSWPCEQPGMQGGSELTGDALADAKRLYSNVYAFTLAEVEAYLESHPDAATRLHKSTVNRLLEPFMWHTVVATSTEWMNFFLQRSTYFTDLTQKDIAVAADRMWEVMQESVPVPLAYGDWHLPFVDDDDWMHAIAYAAETVLRAIEGQRDSLDILEQAGYVPPRGRGFRIFSETIRGEDQQIIKFLSLQVVKELSVARCALASTMKQEVKRELDLDRKLFDRLKSANPMHASPFEHPCTPATPEEIDGHKVVGNFHGWHQLRSNYQKIKPDSESYPTKTSTYDEALKKYKATAPFAA